MGFLTRALTTLGFIAPAAVVSPVEMGIQGTPIEGAGAAWDEQNPKYADRQVAVRECDETLKTHPLTRAAWRMVSQTVLSGTPELTPAGDSDDARAVADFCERMLGIGSHAGRGTMRQSFESTIHPLLTYVTHGAGTAEKVYRFDFDASQIVLDALKFRRQSSISDYKVNPRGELQSVHQYPVAGVDVEPKPMPGPADPAGERPPDHRRSKVLHVVHDEHLGSHQGAGLLRACFRYVEIDRHAWNQAAVGLEKWANPTPKVRILRAALEKVRQYYDDDKIKAMITGAAEQAAAHYSGSRKYLMSNDLVDFETFGEGAFDPTKALAVSDAAQRQVLLVFLVQFLIMGIGDVGSRALGLVHQNILQRACMNILQQVGEALTEQVLKPLVQWNFGEAAAARLMPAFEWVGLDFDPLMEALGQLPALVAAGIVDARNPALKRRVLAGLRVKRSEMADTPAALEPPAGAEPYADNGQDHPDAGKGRPEGSYDDAA